MRMQQLNNEIITPEMMEIKSMIIETFVQRDAIKNEMEHWYDINPGKHFPKMKELVDALAGRHRRDALKTRFVLQAVVGLP